MVTSLLASGRKYHRDYIFLLWKDLPQNRIPDVTSTASHGRFCAVMKLLMPLCTFALALGLVTGQAQEQKDSKTKPEKKSDPKEEKMNSNEVAVIRTSEGEMVVEFWTDVAPKTVENFKTLAKKGFYDGTCFHRVIKDFMIQGGDPLTKDPAQEARWGTGDPGYKIKAEFNDRHHDRGVLSMARSNNPDSAGSQFFICHGNPRFLDQQYTAFGKLIKGDDVLEKIATTPTHAPDRPNKRMAVESIKIVPADSVK
jgi:peptidyl-prolyl cis-trans isomerase B (cyclophilin B)